MKTIMKYLITNLLGLMARGIIARYNPTIIMITGSVGKTSTKDAVAAVLESSYFIRKSEKSFNSEYGVPFTILGVTNPWGSPLAWLSIFKRAVALLLLPNHYPTILVLEVGADRPGDIAHILRIATPHAVVVTRLPEIPVHVEAYTTPEAVREEEFSPALALPPGAPLVVSADEPCVLAMAKRIPARVLTYGESEGAIVRVTDVAFAMNGISVTGMRASIHTSEVRNTIVVPCALGKTQLLPLAAAVALGSTFNISTETALSSLQKNYTPPPGRCRLLRGIAESVLIDDSYNASPTAVVEALTTLKSFPHAARRIAVLGDMLELGRYSVQEHERIGSLARNAADIVIAVGIRARGYAKGDGSSEVRVFDDSRAAAAALRGLVQKGDVLLIKGSQSIRMERIVEALLADATDICNLVRQETDWKSRS